MKKSKLLSTILATAILLASNVNAMKPHDDKSDGYGEAAYNEYQYGHGLSLSELATYAISVFGDSEPSLFGCETSSPTPTAPFVETLAATKQTQRKKLRTTKHCPPTGIPSDTKKLISICHADTFSFKSPERQEFSPLVHDWLLENILPIMNPSINTKEWLEKYSTASVSDGKSRVLTPEGYDILLDHALIMYNNSSIDLPKFIHHTEKRTPICTVSITYKDPSSLRKLEIDDLPRTIEVAKWLFSHKCCEDYKELKESESKGIYSESCMPELRAFFMDGCRNGIYELPRWIIDSKKAQEAKGAMPTFGFLSHSTSDESVTDPTVTTPTTSKPIEPKKKKEPSKGMTRIYPAISSTGEPSHLLKVQDRRKRERAPYSSSSKPTQHRSSVPTATVSATSNPTVLSGEVSK